MALDIRHEKATNLQIAQNIVIYTDGSFSRRSQKLGMGMFIVQNGEETLLWQPAKKIEGLPQDKQNVAAEVLAAAIALEEIPPNSKVILNTDLYETIKFINDGDFHHPHASKQFKAVWDRLQNAINRHESVTATYASDKPSARISPETKEIMILVHNAAALGSGANTKKALTGDYAEIYGHLFEKPEPPPKSFGSTPGALEII